jgi:lysine decarboxylase/arginine decarboxylase
MGIAGYDPTKLVIAVNGCGLSGKAFAAALRQMARMGVEFADPRNIICSLSIADDEAKVDALVHALRAVAASAPGRPLLADKLGDQLPIPPLALSPREALRRPTRAIPLAAATGAVCAEQVMPYPPGIPLLVPGEIITAELIERLKHLLTLAITLVGPEDPQLATIRVVV